MHLLQGLNLASVGAETDRRGFVPVNEKMQVLDTKGKPVPGVWCIGDANGETEPQHSTAACTGCCVMQSSFCSELHSELHAGVLGTSWLAHILNLLRHADAEPVLLHVLQASTCLRTLPAPRASAL